LTLEEVDQEVKLAHDSNRHTSGSGKLTDLQPSPTSS